MKANTIEELFGTLQQSIVAEWRKHLQTSKYSKHMALDEFYKEMPELVDSLIEDYNGHTGHKVEDFKNVLKAEDLDALQYLEQLHELAQSGYDLLPDDAPELKSDLDAIKSQIDSTMYKVRELKESLVNLSEYLKEAISISESSNAKDKKYWKEISKLNFKGTEKESEIKSSINKLKIDDDFSDWFFDKAMELQDLSMDNDWKWGSDDNTEYTSWGVVAMGEDFYNKVLNNDSETIKQTEKEEFSEFGEYCGYAF